SSIEMHLPRVKVWVWDLTTRSVRAHVSLLLGVSGMPPFPQTLEYGEYLQGALILTHDIKTQMWPTSNIRVMIRMPIIIQMIFYK
ncbi:hypothetical protein HGM15179_018781, partial [Zosterops borbonicus]